MAGQATMFESITIGDLAATWQAPAGDMRAAALILAGSGPTDRDGNGPAGLRTDAYRLLAEALARLGIASLRYDKRGIGQSATGGRHEADLTILDLVADARDVLAELARRAPGHGLTVIGHSEGALVGTLLAQDHAVSRLVLLCGAGFPFGQVLRRQISATAAPEAWKLAAFAVMDQLDRGILPGPVAPDLAVLFRESVQPFLASVWSLDPVAWLADTTMPALVIGGGLDIQVGRADFDRLSAARPALETAWFDMMAHTLKDGEGQDMAALYGNPDLSLQPGLADRIARIILA